jgi:hypothetical protein
MTKTKKPRNTKNFEIEEFKTEVQNYIKTGKSTVLTAKEKANLDKIRPVSSPNLWDKFVEFLKK